VGHSLGGLYLQLFAREYPDEVAGLVLVDSSHPSQMAGARGRPARTFWTMLLSLYMTGVRGREFRALNQTGEQVLGAPGFDGARVTVLSAGHDPALEGREPTPGEALRLDVARLYPGSQQHWVDSGHNIQVSHPQVVIDAIREHVLRARAALAVP
jgi:pimeloyl-ACP methyl ester carboxylesterase